MNAIYQVMTPSEVETTFELPTGSVRRDLHRDKDKWEKFRKSEVRKSGSTWLIMSREALRIYKDDIKMIPVKVDWDWVVDHVDNEMNDVLENEVLTFLNDDIDRIYELYMDGVKDGIEDGKYLTFTEWFYRYKESEDEKNI
ncbi:helix-turn-helix domain-containing protein [Tuberibacillus sp. Marseille-P3662]|uniref:helix-turn-helix domain-containing protein n=1 Tax=Tuberibacillus sp. Marseille-P3662 TaxID=1965358 RepID=UPI000A1CC85A|nr:helix-turn-helix domain-containing protein [Tuberibacillus sp. Marseille-P3662]